MLPDLQQPTVKVVSTLSRQAPVLPRTEINLVIDLLKGAILPVIEAAGIAGVPDGLQRLTQEEPAPIA
jgi:hypothetical protein